jgi:SSS family solute:Na+ symporter
MIAFALAKTGKAPGLDAMVGPDGRPIPLVAQSAYPMLVMSVLPVGVRGMVVAGLIAALMSSMSGAFNASSTLFTMDLYQKLRPNSSQHELVWMGRVATAVMVFIALLWIPVIEGARGLYEYLQSVQGYLAPPIFTVFFFGIFNKRLNTKGCITALVVGFLLGTFRLLVDTPVALHLRGYENGYATGSFLWIVNNIYFQYYSLLVFVVSVVVMIGVSYATAAPATERLTGLTFATITHEHRQESRSSWTRWDVIASGMVLVLILAAYLYFSG